MGRVTCDRGGDNRNSNGGDDDNGCGYGGSIWRCNGIAYCEGIGGGGGTGLPDAAVGLVPLAAADDLRFERILTYGGPVMRG